MNDIDCKVPRLTKLLPSPAGWAVNKIKVSYGVRGSGKCEGEIKQQRKLEIREASPFLSAWPFIRIKNQQL